MSFQFTRPRGARRISSPMLPINDSFQFTRPRGARRAFLRVGELALRFNSRAHGGRDFVRSQGRVN